MSRETRRVLVVRGTKKLRDRVKGPVVADGDESTTVLGDWFATALFWKPQVALLVNQRTFVPVFMPLAPASTLLDRAPDAIAAVLRRLGADVEFIEAELGAMRVTRIAPTNDRSVVGVVSGFSFHGEVRWHDGVDDLEDLSVELADMPIGPLHNRSGAADRELAAVLGFDPKTTGGRSATAFQLKVTLSGTEPPIWRRVLVDGSASLAELHNLIQAAFGWWNCHLFEFELDDVCYGIPDPDFDDDPPERDARRTRLVDVASSGVSFNYTYDFGDGWEHEVIVENLLDMSAASLPACVDGRRAGPPEDCGGVWGYAELLSILADPSHPEHAERARWASRWGSATLDPERFDPSEFAHNLRTLRLAFSDN